MMSELLVGIRELKSRLSHYIRHVKSGKTLTITERGKPVGRIIPIKEEQSLEEKLEAMAQAGLLAWNGEKLEPMEPVVRTRGERTVADLLIEDRE
jgi:prevent-host-death family protein